MTERGLLIVFSGPSGAGKGTVLKELLAKRDDCVLSISAATRAPRDGEVDGREYYFKSQQEFRAMVDAGHMLEWAEYSGNCYGTPAAAVEELRAKGINVILEIEVLGALQIKKQCPEAVFVFLAPPSMEVLRQRLLGRGTEDPEAAQKRLARAEYELSKMEEYDYIIVSKTAQQSCDELDAIITAARCSMKHNPQLRKECQDA